MKCKRHQFFIKTCQSQNGATIAKLEYSRFREAFLRFIRFKKRKVSNCEIFPILRLLFACHKMKTMLVKLVSFGNSMSHKQTRTQKCSCQHNVLETSVQHNCLLSHGQHDMERKLVGVTEAEVYGTSFYEGLNHMWIYLPFAGLVKLSTRYNSKQN